MCCVFLVGCATAYKPNGFAGGFSDTQLAPDVFRVNFRGNGYTSAERVQNFAMLRAAELALEHGYSHFAIINEQDGIAGATSFYDNHASITIFKHRSGLMVKCFVTKPDGVFSLDAEYLRHSIRQRYNIPEEATPQVPSHSSPAHSRK
jgi:hypothetical protein